MTIKLYRLLFTVLAMTIVLAGCAQNSTDENGDDDDDDTVAPYQFRSAADGLQMRVEGGDWQPFFSLGINFGLTVPGTFPGELAASREQIARWLEAAADLGVNTIRIYTIQMPEFYEELRAWNIDHPDRVLFLLQGAWLKEPDNGVPDYLSDASRAWFRGEIERAVNVVHGNATIEPGSEANPDNWGRAYGSFTADVSPWLLGYLVGRELEPYTILNAVDLHPNETAYTGDYFSIENGEPIETFVIEHLDYLVAYEKANYGQEHTIGFSNWPTLDPLIHYTEPPYPVSSEEMFSLDMTKAKINEDNFSSGMFISYHAYPYYPDFILYQPEYQVSDAQGVNSYYGYLQALRDYYDGYTLMVAEIGFPSSQGSAHYAASGLTHGGMNEAQQGEAILRAVGNIVDAGFDGAMIFSLIDEWYKVAWIVEEVEIPADRRRTWHNPMSPEQNFGLIALRPGAQGAYHVIDGRDDEWFSAPQLSKTGGPATALDQYDALRTLTDLTVEHDEGYLHLRLGLADLDPDGNGQVDWDQVDYLLAIDTIDPQRGDSRIAQAPEIVLGRRAEFLLQIVSDQEVNLLVDQPYDLYGLWHYEREAWQKYRSEANDDGAYNLVRTITNWEYEYDGVELGARIDQETGRLPTGDEADNSLTNLWYSLDDDVLEIRLPWNLLNFTDPSQRWVVDGDGEQNIVAAAPTDEIAVAAVALAGDGTLADTLPVAQSEGDDLLLPAADWAVYTWGAWEMPTFHEYRKASFTIVQDGLPGIVPAAAYLP
ncbi:MAG TPA: hypothetical protein PKW95_03130 [bacterium]|nr:hypothetical protein [bacterium]